MNLVLHSYRYYDKNNKNYYYTYIFGRASEYGYPLLGLKTRLYNSQEYLPFNYQISGMIYMQKTKLFNIEWRSKLDFKLSKKYELSLKTKHTPYISAFAQIMSNNKYNENFYYEIDRDIFSQYKLDHQTGLNFGDSIIFQPYLDTILKTGISMTTNEDNHILELDNISLNTQIQQFINPFIIDIKYRFRLYNSDNDRTNSFSKNLFSLKLSWNKWFKNFKFIDLGCELSYEIESKVSSGMFFIKYYFDNDLKNRIFFSEEAIFSNNY